jgi:hypothetical protein
MLTSEAVDLYGADRRVGEALGRYLSRPAFEQAGLFSYGAFKTVSFLARLPRRTRRLRRLRRNANKVIMYMMQAHMLHDMFIADPMWERRKSRGEERPAAREKALVG